MRIQTFGKKKKALALINCKKGKGYIKINGFIINSLEPPFIRDKILEPFLLIENMKKVPIDADIYVKGGGCISRVYAIRQAIAKALLVYYLKYVSMSEMLKIKFKFLKFDDKLLFSNNKPKEPKKFGGKGARSRFQKSYR